MKSVFAEYKHLWPKESLAKIEPLLTKISVLHYPQDERLIAGTNDRNVVVVTNKNLYDGSIPLFEAGFEHCIQAKREDFANELLASSFMVLRPGSFMRDPIPFFFNGFQTKKATTDSGRHVRFGFNSTHDAAKALKGIEKFLMQDPRMVALHDVCMQAADELVSNALFHAPINPGGARPNSRVPRNQEAALPDGKSGSLFACFSDQRVIIGCSDPFGSLDKRQLLNHLRVIFQSVSAPIKMTGESGGLGLKFVIENAANIYVLVTARTQTLIACGFLLAGLKANSAAAKHLHISFR
jgi:hypothetical protein